MEKRNLFLLVGLIAAFGLILFIYDLRQAKVDFDGILTRNDPGQGDYTEELVVSSEYYEGDYNVEVSELLFSEEEAYELFALAEAEIDETFLGENEDLNNIWTDVVVDTSYQSGQVSASWYFDDFTLVNSDGTVSNEGLEESVIVGATITLTCGSYEEIYSFSFCVIPIDAATQEAFLYRLQQEINANDGESETLVLPDEVDGVSVYWSKKLSYRGLGLIGLAIIAFFAIPIAQKEEQRRQLKARQQELLKDYPKILSQLSLLLRVGISFSEAAARIAVRYEDGLKKGNEVRPGFELIARLSRQIKDGVSEIRALDDLAREAKIKEYRKLVLLLQQNQKKGNQHVIEQLEKEDIEAFEMRKAMAKRAGEEASTKLLLPMIGMLGVMMLILVIPAILTMSFS